MALPQELEAARGNERFIKKIIAKYKAQAQTLPPASRRRALGNIKVSVEAFRKGIERENLRATREGKVKYISDAELAKEKAARAASLKRKQREQAIAREKAALAKKKAEAKAKSEQKTITILGKKIVVPQDDKVIRGRSPFNRDEIIEYSPRRVETSKTTVTVLGKEYPVVRKKVVRTVTATNTKTGEKRSKTIDAAPPKVEKKGILRAAGKITGSITALVRKGKDALAKIPVVGAPLATIYSIGIGSQFEVVRDVAHGERIDRVAYNSFKRDIKNAQDIAPYVQTVISVVPAIGPGVSGAIGAANALTKGHRIDAAIVEGVKDSLPGGPAVRAAVEFSYAVATGARPEEAVVQALPIGPTEKKLLLEGVGAVGDIARGARLDTTLVDRGIAVLPDPEMRKAAQIGIALAEGKRLQDLMLKEAPHIMGKLQGEGEKIVQQNQFFKDGLSAMATADEKIGYTKGVGLMSKKLAPVSLEGALKAIPESQRAGFEMALGAATGVTEVGIKPNMTMKEAFGVALARGLKGKKATAADQRLFTGLSVAETGRLLKEAKEIQKQSQGQVSVKASTSVRAARKPKMSPAEKARLVAAKKSQEAARKAAGKASATHSDALLIKAAAADPEIGKGIAKEEETWWEKFLQWIGWPD